MEPGKLQGKQYNMACIEMASHVVFQKKKEKQNVVKSVRICICIDRPKLIDLTMLLWRKSVVWGYLGNHAN